MQETDLARLYNSPPPQGCDDLTIYLRHLCNDDRMLTGLREALQGLGHPASLCWFGDHVPIMPTVYDTFGVPHGDVDHFLWTSWEDEQGRMLYIPAHELALRWLDVAIS